MGGGWLRPSAEDTVPRGGPPPHPAPRVDALLTQDPSPDHARTDARPHSRPSPRARESLHHECARQSRVRKRSIRGAGGPRRRWRVPPGAPTDGIVGLHVSGPHRPQHHPRPAQSGPARGGDGHAGPRPRAGGGGQREDAGDRPPHRLASRRRGRPSAQPPRRHLHQQGGGGDAPPRGGPGAPGRDPASPHRHLPLDKRAHAPPARAPDRAAGVVRHLRRGRPPDPHEGSGPRAGLRRAGPEPLERRPPREPRQEPDARPGGGRSPGPDAGRGARGHAVRAVRGAPAAGGGGGLRRPPPARGEAARRGARGADVVPGPVAARARRRVPGHQPRAVPHDPAAHRGAPQPVRGGRPRPVRVPVARGRSPQHSRLRARLSRLPHRAPRAELPLDPAHPGHGAPR